MIPVLTPVRFRLMLSFVILLYPPKQNKKNLAHIYTMCGLKYQCKWRFRTVGHHDWETVFFLLFVLYKSETWKILLHSSRRRVCVCVCVCSVWRTSKKSFCFTQLLFIPVCDWDRCDGGVGKSTQGAKWAWNRFLWDHTNILGSEMLVLRNIHLGVLEEKKFNYELLGKFYCD